MEDLLLDVTNRLQSNVAALKYVDEDWGQLDFYAPNPPVKWPCALVDASQVTWSNEGKNIQHGLAQVKIRLADLRLSNSSTKAPDSQKAKAFGIYGTIRDIYKALQGWSGAGHYSKLIRTTMSRIKREDGIRIYEITFTTTYKDISAMPQYQQQEVAADIKMEIIKPQ